MEKICGLLFLLIVLMMGGCSPDSFLNKDAPGVLSVDQIFADQKLVKSNVADLYNRIHEFNKLGTYQQPDEFQFYTFSEFPYVFPSNGDDYKWVRNLSIIEYGRWEYWDYGYLYSLNLFLDRIDQADQLDPEVQKRFKGEAQFLRAYFYMKEVKRMGGVPILRDTLRYDFSGNASNLYKKRNSESEVYDFIINQADSAAQNLPKDPSDKDRATWGAAMALKSKAALFAGSIAQYSSTTPSVTLPDNVVGIPKNKATQYYQTALNAAQQIIDSGQYSLYNKVPDNLSENFTNIFLDKNNNEIIFQKNHNLTDAGNTQFTRYDQPHSNSEEAATSGYINPSLNFVQSFEKIDNTFATFVNKNPDGSFKRYDTKAAIFDNRDARLAGTVILPGTQFRGDNLDIFAGYYLPQQPAGQRFVTGAEFGQQQTLPGESNPIKIVGNDGPINNRQHGTQTGFYLRKYVEPTTGAGQIGTGSSLAWIRFRYGEILLNAAEASFELGDKSSAATYLNKIRARAGLTQPLSTSDMTFKRIVHERLTELAFEGHRLWDLKRWRLADEIWDGGDTDLDHPSDPVASSTKPYGLWPYKVHDPGQTDDGKWIFKRVLPSPVERAENFRLGNYYSRIPDDVLGNNPLLIQNPNQ